MYRDAAKDSGNALNHNIGGGSSLLATTIQKNADPTSRLFQMNELERDYTRQTLNPALMKLFHYTHPQQ
jgi:hypothetical protein